MIMTEGSAI